MKKFFKVLLSIMLVGVGTFSQRSTLINAAGNEIPLLNVEHTVVNEKGLEPDRITQYTELTSTIKFKLPQNVLEGDVTTIAVPDGLYFNNDFTETLYHTEPDGTKYAFATMHIDSATNIVTLTYLPAVEQFSNISGTMFFTNRIKYQNLTEGEVTLDFMYGNESKPLGPFDYEFVGDSPDEIFNKYNWFVEGSKREVINTIRVNPSGEFYNNPIVKDILRKDTSAMTYVQESLVIHKGDWELNSNGIWELRNPVQIYPVNETQFQDPTVSFDLDENSFLVDFGNHKDGVNGSYIGEYRIRYTTRASYDILPGEEIRNYAAVYDQDELILDRTVPLRMDSAGGSTEGYQYSITVNKVDDLGQALSGATFRLTRKASQEVVGTVTMTSGTHTFSGLLYDTYILEEIQGPDGYKFSTQPIEITPADFGSQTNKTITVENNKLINIEGTKTWVDENDQDRLRPNDITLTLYANGIEVSGVTPTWVKNGNVWTYRYENLVEYQNGSKIVYTVEEELVPGYALTQNGFDLTNTHVPGMISISGTKTWVDGNNQDGLRPDTIELTLYADGVKVEGVQATWNKQGNVWLYEFANLPEFKAGVKIDYQVKETQVQGYTLEQNGFDLTNTHVPSTISIQGTKTWVDGNNQDGIRPNNLDLTIYANGVEVENVDPTWVKNGNVWSYEYVNLPEFENGVAIVYTVKETPVPGYSASQDGFNLTNTHVPGTINIEGTKTWVDNHNQDGLRPESITLNLYANGISVEDVTPTWVKDGDVWTYVFASLPEYKDGSKIVYTVEETLVPGYTLTQEGYDLVNTHEPEVAAIKGIKTWVDNDDILSFRPDSITVRLYANGIEIENVVPTWSKNGNTWTYIFEGMPVYNNGTEIVYSISEDAVSEYVTSIDGFNITNTLKEQPSVVKPETLPSTGKANNIVGPSLIVLGLAILAMNSKRRRNEI